MPEIIPIPAVNTAIFNENNEILLTRRSSTVREPGKWCLPGGHLEVGNSGSMGPSEKLKKRLGFKSIKLFYVGSIPTLNSP
ncbi:NUDIX domain-containing protein [bacterium]|nr:NUDIX domain-containing protein [bacterium]